MAEAMDVQGQIRDNLKDSACPDALIEVFMDSIMAGKKDDGLHMLSEHREALLNTVHQTQEHLDCLDYLVYKITRGDY